MTFVRSVANRSCNHAFSIKFRPFSQLHIPSHFHASATSCSIKKSNKLDLALIKSSLPCNGAAVFTKNKFQAAPVQISRRIIENFNSNTTVCGIIVNSGCANAVTGQKGIEDAQRTQEIANWFGIKNALVMSTGVIGEFLPMEKIQKGITEAAQLLTSDENGFVDASKAIMTTDTVNKILSTKVEFEGGQYTILGMCKGAGMIHPNMATMLSILLTDANIAQPLLQRALTHAVNRSFNCASVDGDTSTNDTVALLANGASKTNQITTVESKEYNIFVAKLTELCQNLTKKLVRDGEGATKLIEIEVCSAKTIEDAHSIADAIAKSPLVKTAIHGEDANWGRILCAVGYSNAYVEPEEVDMWFVDNEQPEKSLHILKDGAPHKIDEKEASRILSKENIYIRVELNVGKEMVKVWTCDFSEDYIRINADYRS